MHSFNVAFEPWIPVRRNGGLELLSLSDTLTQAHTITGIEDASPLVTASLHRLLEAVLHRALQGPYDLTASIKWWQAGNFPQDAITRYLETWRHRFDLFDETHPFYQTAEHSVKPKSIANLAAELAGGSNKLLFDHTQESAAPALSPAQTARLLVARQMLAIPEGAGYSPSPIGGTAVVLMLGSNLHETLCLNAIEYDPDDDKDVPIWESNALPEAEQPIWGLTQRYTWMSRLVKLIPESITDETGEVRTVIRSMQYSAACKLKQGAFDERDPMLAHRVVDEKTGDLRAINFRRNRDLWRDYASFAPKGAYPPKVVNNATAIKRKLKLKSATPMLVVGATNDKAKFEFWRSELFVLPEALTSDASDVAYGLLTKSLMLTEDTGRALRGSAFILASHLLAHSDGRDPDRNDVSKLAGSFPTMQLYWSRLGLAFHPFLHLFSEDFDAKTIESYWITAVRDAMNAAWSATRIAAGDDAFALRAIYTAERSFAKQQAELTKKLEELNPTKGAA